MQKISTVSYHQVSALLVLLQTTLAILDKLDLDSERPSEEEVARKFGYEEDYLSGKLTCWQKVKPKIWSLFDEPYSCSAAKVSYRRLDRRRRNGRGHGAMTPFENFYIYIICITFIYLFVSKVFQKYFHCLQSQILKQHIRVIVKRSELRRSLQCLPEPH